MTRKTPLLVLATVILCMGAHAQTAAPSSDQAHVPSSTAGASTDPHARPATCPQPRTLDDLTKALDDAVSGPADKDRTCMRVLFYPDSRMVPVGKTREATFAPRALTVDNWIDAMKKRGSSVFYERQVKVKTEMFGHIAHLWCTYEIRPSPEGKATIRGINSIQAVFDGTRWKITQIEWEAETPTEPIPGPYLP